MDHRTRANDYAKQLKDAKDRIFELECELADVAERESKACQTTAPNQQPAPHQSLPTPSAEPNIKVETSPPPRHENDAAALREEITRLTSDLDAYYSWAEQIQEETGVAPSDVVMILKNFKGLVESAKGTESALRQQIRTHVAKAKKQTEVLEKLEKERDQAVKEARKYRTDVRRFFETGLKATWIKDHETSTPPKGRFSGEGAGTVSASASPVTGTPATPRTPGSAESKRRPVVLGDEDDEEDVPLKQRRAGFMASR